jgi:metal-sulfur cluster biosynthetic enzyme
MTAGSLSAGRAGIERAIEAAMARVDDPCSIAARAPLNVVELGLIRDWRLDEDGQVHVTISPTAPSCVLIASIAQGIERRVGAVDGVTGVQVYIDTDTVWLPELMTDTGRDKLAQRRSRSQASVPVHPRQWQATVIPHA